MKLGKLASDLRPLLDGGMLNELGVGDGALWFYRDGSKSITGDIEIDYAVDHKLTWRTDDGEHTLKATQNRLDINANRLGAMSLDIGSITSSFIYADFVKGNSVEANYARVTGAGGYGGIGIDSDALWFDTDRALFAFNGPVVIHQDQNHSHYLGTRWVVDAGTTYAQLYASNASTLDRFTLQGSQIWLNDGTGNYAAWTFSSEGAQVQAHGTGYNRLTVNDELWVYSGGSHYIAFKVAAGPQIITDNNYLELKANSGGAYADFSLNSEGLLVEVTGSTTSNHNVQLRQKLYVTNSDGTWAISLWADNTRSYIQTNAASGTKIIQALTDNLEIKDTGSRVHQLQGTSEGLTVYSAGNGHTTLRNDLYIYDGTNTARLQSKSNEALRVRHPSSAYYFDIENHSEGATLDVTASSNNKHLTFKAADYYLYNASGNYSVLTAESNGFKIQPRGSNYVKIVEGSNYVQFLPNSGGVQIDATTGGAEALYFTGKVINIGNASAEYRVNNTKVVTARRTGWTAWTGTATRGSIATGSATLTNVAEAVKALIDDLITHGLIGA